MKRPLQSFIAFNTERLRKLKETSTGPLKFLDIARESSVLWNKLSDAEKKVNILL